MRPQYRFTLDENKLISEPIGWNQMIPELNRDKKYWSLVESVEIPLMFYGNSADGDGGYDYLKEVRQNGPDTQVEFLVEISWDFGVTFETFFEGLLDLTEMIDMETDRKFQCTVMRNSSWSRFMNRADVPVIVSDTATDHSLSMPSQEMRQLYVGIHSDDISYNLSFSYGIIDWKIVNRNEIKIKSNLPRGFESNDPPVELFEMEYDGYYTFTGDVYIASAAFFPTDQVTGIDVQIQINDETPISWTMEQLGTNGVDGRTHFYYNALHTLEKGDQVRIYFFGSGAFVWTDFFLQGLSVIADTTYKTTTASSFFIHDVAQAIANGVTEDSYFYSAYFGGLGTQTIDYHQEGCGVYYRLLKGRHIRGESLSIKPFSLSWNSLWEGIDPIFMLGAGYETVSYNVGGSTVTKEVVRVEPRAQFFDDSSVSVTLDQYDMDFKLEISYDQDFLLTSIQIGYQKWQAQNIAGNDDPQTQHTYGTRFKTIGGSPKDIQVLSSFVAASLAIEQGRRLSEVLSQDWPMDEETFIIQASSSLSPNEVKLYSNDVVSGLENANTRYNIRLTPASNFNRWMDWLSIAFQEYVGDVFPFRDGQGNTQMVFNNPGATGCDAEPGTYADEDADIPIQPGSIILPLLYKFNVPFTWENWKAVRDNRKKAIQLNYLNNKGEETNVILFIKSLKYDPSKSEAAFECWLKGTAEFEYEIGMQLKIDGSLLASTPRWDVTYSTPEASDTLSIELTVSTLEGDSSVFTGRQTITATAAKISNSGIAEGGDGRINWVKNGATVHTVDFTTGNDMSEEAYIFTGVTDSDVLVVEIFEGLTS